ncbi:hypothetical protein Tco_0387111 [Tanacetum coccineum]
MRTCSRSYPNNNSSTIPRRNRRRSQQQVPPNLVEPPKDTMADQRTMAELLQAPIEGYEDAIVVPAITADNFELKHGLLTLIQNKQFFGHDKEDLTGKLNSCVVFPTRREWTDIESKDSYVSNLDESALLVTPLSDANEDECFDPGGDIDEINAFLDMDISMDIEDGYYDLEGDIVYLESLLINDIIPNFPPDVFLDHDLRSLKDELDANDLKSMVKNFDLDISAYSFYSLELVAYECPMEDCPYYEDSRARGFVHRPLDLQSLASLYMGIRYPRSY